MTVCEVLWHMIITRNAELATILAKILLIKVLTDRAIPLHVECVASSPCLFLHFRKDGIPYGAGRTGLKTEL